MLPRLERSPDYPQPAFNGLAFAGRLAPAPGLHAGLENAGLPRHPMFMATELGQGPVGAQDRQKRHVIMKPNSFRPITSRSVTLRYFVEEDAPKVFAMSQEAGLRAWLPDQVYDCEAGARKVLRYLIEKYGDPATPSLAPYVLGVCCNGSQELIGHVGLSPLRGQVEVGYAIEQQHQGRGFASEAVKAMSEWAGTFFGLSRILGVVASDNVASCRVLQHAGFELTGESMGELHGRPGLVRTYERVH